MPTYLSLMRWTKEGVEKIKESPARLEAGKKAVEAGGGKMVSFYMLMGEYDMAIVVEAPDDASASLLQRRVVCGRKRCAPSPRTNTGRSSRAFPERRLACSIPLRPERPRSVFTEVLVHAPRHECSSNRLSFLIGLLA
jgi:hypothetical protein